MARDVAQRELDQAGFRIASLGDPKEKGDATKTDNTSVPKASAGTGSPGASLLAAAADHAHPAADTTGGGFLFSRNDLSEQSVSGTPEEVVAEFLVNFADLKSPHMAADITALVKVSAGTAKFRALLGGMAGRTDGTELLSFTTSSTEFQVGGAGKEGVDAPKTGVTLVKIVGATDRSDTVAYIRSKAVQFRGQP